MIIYLIHTYGRVTVVCHISSSVSYHLTELRLTSPHAPPHPSPPPGTELCSKSALISAQSGEKSWALYIDRGLGLGYYMQRDGL